ncbi:unnamed protein product [Allacma fusca]|nr:unnamed protein product [Allacma fusca]
MCWYCFDTVLKAFGGTFLTRQYEFYQFNCTPRYNCYKSMDETYKAAIQNGRNIFWSFYPTRIIYGLHHKLADKNPFSRVEPVDIQQAVANYLTQALNLTFDLHVSVFISNPAYVHLSPKADFVMADYYPTGFTTSFNFITSHEVSPVRTTFQYYAPFDWTIWALITGSIVCVAIIAQVISRIFDGSSANSFRAFQLTCFWLYGGLVDQWNEIRQIPEKAKTFYATVGIIWLLNALIITNSFKGMVKSNQVLSRPFETKHKYLRELLDFKLIVPITNCPTDYFASSIIAARNSKYYNQTRVKGMYYCPSYQIAFFSVVTSGDILNVVEDAIKTLGATAVMGAEKSKLRSYEILRENVCYICDYHIDKLIHSILSAPEKAAFLSSRADFEHYWSIFEKYMENETIVFAHNGNILDDYILKRSVGITISTGFEKSHDLISTRAKILIQSGVYWFWEKWDAIIFPTHSSSVKRRCFLNDPKPVSLDKTDIYLIFRMLMGFLALDAVVFSFEVCVYSKICILTFFKRKLKN